jgi:hypothetical protein
MNPLIRKFWEDAGKAVYGPNAKGSYTIYIGAEPIFLIETIAHGDMYRFNKKWYSEEEMLRIIKIKAFI